MRTRCAARIAGGSNAPGLQGAIQEASTELATRAFRECLQGHSPTKESGDSRSNLTRPALLADLRRKQQNQDRPCNWRHLGTRRTQGSESSRLCADCCSTSRAGRDTRPLPPRRLWREQRQPFAGRERSHHCPRAGQYYPHISITGESSVIQNGRPCQVWTDSPGSIPNAW